MKSATVAIIVKTFSLGLGPFETFDPFLFCVNQHDRYPVDTTSSMGVPADRLSGRDIADGDFSNKDGFSMYFGTRVPGFPAHPHRGFETITIVQEGFVDHSDSYGATGRYGNGDTQWMTAGKGIQHAEMFPLLSTDKPNTLNLFQVWLNLPARSKFCDPYFGMLWDEVTPRASLPDAKGGAATAVRVIAGELGGVKPLAPPPNSWAHDAEHDVAVWVLNIPAGSTATLPPARGGAATTRAVYFTQGKQLRVADEQTMDMRTGARVRSDAPLSLHALAEDAMVLILQGKPIGEPVASQYGPNVMNTEAEVEQSLIDFEKTKFGGWPWESTDRCHPRTKERHAIHSDGTVDLPPSSSPSSL